VVGGHEREQFPRAERCERRDAGVIVALPAARLSPRSERSVKTAEAQVPRPRRTDLKPQRWRRRERARRPGRSARAVTPPHSLSRSPAARAPAMGPAKRSQDWRAVRIARVTYPTSHRDERAPEWRERSPRMAMA